MRKYLISIIFCSIVWAGQFSGIIIDEATGKGLEAELLINSQKVSIASAGHYDAIAPDSIPNHYLVRLPNGKEYLFITAGNELNLQLSPAKPSNYSRNMFLTEIKVNLYDNKQIVDKADVSIHAFRFGRTQPQISKTIIRDYHHGKAIFDRIPLTDAMYLLVSRNANLYIQKLENLVPGRVVELDIDLQNFSSIEKISGVAHRPLDGAYEIASLPSANTYYVTQNIIPVYLKTLDENTLLAIGTTPNFPTDIDYYNVRELLYSDENEKKLTVYTDQKTVDVSMYGKYVLMSQRYFYIKDFRMHNFSPSILNDVQEQATWEAISEENNEDEIY